MKTLVFFLFIISSTAQECTKKENKTSEDTINEFHQKEYKLLLDKKHDIVLTGEHLLETKEKSSYTVLKISF